MTTSIGRTPHEVDADWYDGAACTAPGLPELFDRAGEALTAKGPVPADDRRVIRAAVTTCATCPVAARCLEQALTLESNGGRWGVYGGATPAERSKIMTARAKADKGDA